MAHLENVELVKFLDQAGRTAYAANNLLNFIDEIERVYSDEHLQLIIRIIEKNIILENSDKTPRLMEIEIVRGCIYSLDSWLVDNSIKFE
ncbi:hypothetical protein ACPDHJ_06025 [Myroides sp. C8-3]|uniref:hypothetical protein n=1 Tax=Myroides sp. C8-3 TaxID=3400533 RepID=UPI003D2F9B95